MVFVGWFLNVALATSVCTLALCLVSDAASVQLRGAPAEAGYRRVEDLLQMINSASEMEMQQKRATDSCSKSKCQHGKCNSSEGPIQDTGLDYYCLCKGNYGGYFCEIADPCSKCPRGTKSTLRTSMAKSGCFCYDKRANLLPIKA